MLCEKFQPYHNEIFWSLQYCKLTREQSENVTEWIGYLRIKANECGYKAKHRRLIAQSISGINDNDIMTEIT